MFDVTVRKAGWGHAGMISGVKLQAAIMVWMLVFAAVEGMSFKFRGAHATTKTILNVSGGHIGGLSGPTYPGAGQ